MTLGFEMPLEESFIVSCCKLSMEEETSLPEFCTLSENSWTGVSLRSGAVNLLSSSRANMAKDVVPINIVIQR